MTHIIPTDFEFLYWNKASRTFMADVSDLFANGYQPMNIAGGYCFDIVNPKTGNKMIFTHNSIYDKVRDADGDVLYDIFKGQDGLILKVFND